MTAAPSRGGGLIPGVLLIAVGLLFLATELVGFRMARVPWPWFVIAPGLLLYAGMVAGGRSAAVLAVPATFVTIVGLVFLYQHSTNHWESWAYAWALVVPTAAGIGLTIKGIWSGQEQPRRSGRRLMILGMTIFTIAALFFEVIINVSGAMPRDLGDVAWPLALIGVGLVLLLRASRPHREEPSRPLV